MDVFTRAIRGWELARHLTEELSKTALERALESHRPEILHSDQGVQYAATGYVQRLEIAHVQISMAAVGWPTENAYVERLMRTRHARKKCIYTSLVIWKMLGSTSDASWMRSICDIRVHSALGYVPPAEYEAHWYAEHLNASR